MEFLQYVSHRFRCNTFACSNRFEEVVSMKCHFLYQLWRHVSFLYRNWWISAILCWLWCPFVDVIIRSCLMAKSEGRKWHGGVCNCSWHWRLNTYLLSWSKILLIVQRYHSEWIFWTYQNYRGHVCCPLKQIHVPSVILQMNTCLCGIDTTVYHTLLGVSYSGYRFVILLVEPV